MRLSEHFTLDELTFSQTAARKSINNSPTGVIVDNLTRLCIVLEAIRKAIGKPISISSGYRSPALNTAIGSASNSQHCNGCAADFTISGMTPDETVKTIMSVDLSFDQLIREFDRWTHISVPNHVGDTPRKQVLIIDEKGARAYGN